MIRATLIVSLLCVLPGLLEGSTPVVVRVGEFVDERPHTSGLLVREIVRQSVMIAATDLGLDTYDILQLEPDGIPESAKSLTIDLAISPTEVNATLLNSEEPLWKGQAAANFDSAFGVTELVTMMEARSRNSVHDAWRRTCELPQVAGEDTTQNEAVYGSIPRSLTRMDVISQMSVVMALHHLPLDEVEEKHLGILTRAYANLSLLTRHHWNAASITFAARSLIYAERLGQTSSDKKLVALHKLYARSLSGLHAPALDAWAAEELSEEPLPAWAQGALSFARCDVISLVKSSAEHDADAALLQLLRFHAVHDREEFSKLWPVAMEVTELCPMAMGIYEHTYRATPLGGKRWSAAVYPMAVVEKLPQSLQFNEQLISMVGSEDDPHYLLLKRLIREETFLASYFQIANARNAWTAPQDELLETLTGAIAGHPYESYVRSMRFVREDDHAKVVEQMSDLRIDTSVPVMSRFVKSIWRLDSKHGERIGEAAFKRLGHEYTAQSLVLLLRLKEDVKFELVKRLADVSPHSPVALRENIWLTPNPSDEQLGRWEKEIGDDANAWLALGRAHLVKGNREQGMSATRKSLDLEPNLSGYSRLAQAHWVHKDYDKFRATLEECLERTPDQGLGHAAIRKRLAEGLMELGQWEEAEKPAVEAAQTGAAWAMEVAAVCYEGLERWEESEQWVKQLSHAYGFSSRYRWYFWCKRNGRGDLAAARKLVESVAETANGQDSMADATASFYYLEGRLERSLQLYKRARQGIGSSWKGLIMATIADDLGKREEFATLLDKVLADVQEWESQDHYNSAEPRPAFIRQLVMCMRNKPTQGDLDELTELFDQLWLAHRQRHGYFVGRVFQKLGNEERGRHYWKVALDGPFRTKLGAIFAGYHLTGAK